MDAYASALSAAWTATLAARSVATRVTDGPGLVTRSASVFARRDGGGVDAVRHGEGDDVGSVGRAEQLLEALGVERRRLRQEREDAAAVVVDHDDRAGRPAGAADAVRAPASCTNAMSPSSTTTGPPRRAIPSAVDSDAVDAVGAAVGVGPRGRAAVPLEVAHRHRRRHHQLGIVGQGRGDGPRDAGFGEPGLLAEHPLDVRLRPRRCGSPGGRPGGAGPVRSRRRRAPRRLGVEARRRRSCRGR